ncbi:MAG: GNAT family protein [Mobilitalea sp.]
MVRVEEKLKNIVLRNTREADINYVADFKQRPDNALYVGQWTKEQHLNSLYQEDILHLIVEDATTKEPVGYVIMAGLLDQNHNIEFRRIVISEKGKGYGRETLKLIKRLSFEQLHAHRLWLDVRLKNLIAQNLYISEGFIEEGILRDCIFYNGNYESLIVMSILETEYIG